MSDEMKKPQPPRLRRVPSFIRSWDGPNSRLELEMDLGLMPWVPMEALGKELMVLVPTRPAPAEHAEDRGGESTFERALRYVEHAAARSAEFSKLGNGSDPSWLQALETWEWVRDHLTSSWVAGETEAPPQPGGADAAALLVPSLPGAARTLTVAAMALREMPLSRWRDAVGTLDPDLPTREETVQTLLGLARLLKGTPEPGPSTSTSPTEPPPSSWDFTRASVAAPEPPPAAAPEVPADEFGFDYARGYDEGYQTGRRVGRALGLQQARDGAGAQRA